MFNFIGVKIQAFRLVFMSINQLRQKSPIKKEKLRDRKNTSTAPIDIQM
jgi:hypothetical protein